MMQVVLVLGVKLYSFSQSSANSRSSQRLQQNSALVKLLWWFKVSVLIHY